MRRTQESKRGPGRPPLAPGHARTEIARFRLTPAEARQLSARARTDGCDESEVLRRALAAYLARPSSG